MPFSQATAGMPGTDAAKKPQHARQLDVNLFSDVKKIRLRDRNLTSEKILTCYRPDPAPEGRAAARPATPQAKRHWPCRCRCDVFPITYPIARIDAGRGERIGQHP